MNLSENLKKIRKEHNLSQEQLAEKLGVSRQSVSKWESELAYPELDKIIQISSLFNINVDDLLNQNIQEVTKETQSKAAMNKLIDSFLSYITKSIDMFSSMKWKSKLKCILEQCVMITLLFCFFLVFAGVGHYVLDGFISSFPRSAYKIITNVFASIYVILSLVLGTTLMLHIFKIRYLDYYEIVNDKDLEESTVDETETVKTEQGEKHSKKKIFLEKKKEKIIIRDPEGKDYKFIKGLLKMTILFIKFMVALIAFGVGLLLIGLVTCLVCTFMIMKTGVFFIGLLLTFLASILMTLIVLGMMMNFIMNRKSNKKMMLYGFILSLLVFGTGIGVTLIGFTKFQYVQDMTSEHYQVSTQTLAMRNDLIIDDFHNSRMEYIEEERSDIKVELIHTDFYQLKLHERNEFIYFSYFQEEDFLSAIRTQLDDINHMKLVDYSNTAVRIYASRENIEILHKNQENYYKNLRTNDMNRCLEREEEYQEKISELEETIIDLKEELEEQKSLMTEY